jgi:subtilisin family serine protease
MVRFELRRSQTRRSVLTPEIGFPRGTLLPELTELVMNQVIPFAQEQDITVVIPTGNDAPTGLDRITPQNLGTTANGLITVGGVEKNGALFPDTNPDLGSGGSISIYAAARDVLVAGIDSDSAMAEVTGTSLAAPAVAGMAAYFFSLQELDANWPDGSVARAMKQFFALSARVQRNNNPVPDNLGYTPPSAGSIVVACKYHSLPPT